MAALPRMIAVRERSTAELYDLALLLWRRHPLRLGALALAGAAPWAALDAWLLAGPAGNAWWSLALLLLLLAVQGPLATAPMTAWLGEALFADAPPPLWPALGRGLRRWPALLLAGLWRGLLALVPILLLLWPGHLVEVLVLEGAPLRTAWRRAGQLHAAGAGRAAAHWLLAGVAWAAALWLVVGTVQGGLGLLLRADPWDDWRWEAWTPGSHPLVHLATWIAVAYLGSVRFLAYIDLRTRHEGWALGLRLRRAAEGVR